jgi:MOSC domain-containing protein YiiM
MIPSARIVRISVSPGGAPKRPVYSRVSQKRHPGDSRVYARVLREGPLANGDPVRRLTPEEASALMGPR